MKTVQYKRNTLLTELRIGWPALVVPVDHPDAENVSNTKHVRTTPVVKIGEAGDFATANTYYVPID